MSFLRESELDRLDAAHLLPGASIPARYKEDPTKHDDEESIKPSIWKRRRKVPKSYNYSFSALADRNVDKFRTNQKLTMEKVATDIFVDRHNSVYQQQVDADKEGGGANLDHGIPGLSFKDKLNSKINTE